MPVVVFSVAFFFAFEIAFEGISFDNTVYHETFKAGNFCGFHLSVHASFMPNL